MIRYMLANWRDRDEVLRLRMEAGVDDPRRELWDWLNLPYYHTHVAWRDLGQPDDRTAQGRRPMEPLGLTVCLLWPDGAAEDVLTYVRPSERGHGLAHGLRAVQVRDLLRMGWTRLYSAAPADDAAQACARAQFDRPCGTLPDGRTYYGTTLSSCLARLVARGGRQPHPLTESTETSLLRKAEAAHAALTRLSAQGAITLRKAEYRTRPLEAVHG